MDLTRRNFLKAASAATALAAMTGGAAASCEAWLKPSDKAYAESMGEKTAYTFHQQHCGGNCSLMCTVRDGRLVQVAPNEWPGEPKFNTICLKGISEIQHIYGDTRIQTPLKRVGERGSGDFISVSWDEALDECAKQIKTVQSKYGDSAVMFDSCLEPLLGFSFLSDFLKGQMQGEDVEGVDVGIGNGFDPALGRDGTYEMLATNQVTDWKRARTIIHLGTNIVETNLVYNRWFFDAKEAGAKMWCVDPHFSNTASKCDEWLPIKPGTDNALLLGMITLIIDNKWYNEPYVLANTSLPFLVDEKGMLVRAKGPEAGVPVEGSGEANPFKVWDTATSSVKDYNAPGVVPALEGAFAHEGHTVKTVFQQLKENCKNYSLSWASGQTGLESARIEQMTREYALNQPSVLSMGWGGPDKWYNADVVGHAAIILASLIGSIGDPNGGGAGGYPQFLLNVGAEFGEWPIPDDWGPSDGTEGNIERRDADAGVHAVVALGDAFLMHYANTNKTVEWLKGLDFVMVCDIYHTMSADYADIVLPACSKFELNEEVGSVRLARDYVQLQSKVIDPLFESKPDYEIERALAAKLGCDQHLPKTREEYVRCLLEKSEDPALKGITIESLVKNHNLQRLNLPEGPVILFEDQKYPTASGRIDLYYDALVQDKQALPMFEQANEAYDENPLHDKYPLQLTQTRSKFFIHNQFVDAKWIQQYYMTTLELNPCDASARGLQEGDLIEGFNDRGSFSCKCRINAAVRPGSARVCEGQWPRYMENGPVQNVTNDARNIRSTQLCAAPVAPFNDTLIEVRKAN